MSKEIIEFPTLVKGTWVSRHEMGKIAGTYPGFWGGYVAHFTIGEDTYIFQTKCGIRTPRAACMITIGEDGKITIDI